MEDKRSPKPILTWLPKGRNQRRRPATKWLRERNE